MLGPYFAGLDWATHFLKMVRFWSPVVFGTDAYLRRPFDPHSRMPGLTRAHFAYWVGRFHQTVDVHFAGEHAERMKARTAQIADVFQVTHSGSNQGYKASSNAPAASLLSTRGYSRRIVTILREPSATGTHIRPRGNTGDRHPSPV